MDKIIIHSFNDLFNISNTKISELLLNYGDIEKSKIIGYISDIDISDIDKDNELSSCIYYSLSFIKSRDKKFLDKSFKYFYKIIPCESGNSTFLFAIADMLFYASNIYKINLDDIVQEYKKEILKIENDIDFVWLVFALVQNEFCEDKLISKVFDSNVSLSLKESLLGDIKKNCSSGKFEDYSIKLVNIIINLAENSNGLQADYYYNLVIDIYKKISKNDEIDRIKLKKKRLDLRNDVQQHSIKIPTKDLDISINNNITTRIDNALKEDKVLKAFEIVFNTHILPNTNTTRENISLGVLAHLVTISPITAGRKGVVSEKDKEEDYFFYKQYGMGLMSVYSYVFYKVFDYLSTRVNLKDIIIKMYKTSPIYDTDREKLFENIVEKYVQDDYVGFSYSIIPNIEYLIKKILILNNISPHNREYKKEEDITLNSLVSKNKELLSKIYGQDFNTLLEYFFIYEYGLNMRNALMHGDGLSYLSKKYSKWLLFIFIILIRYSKELKND